MAVSNTGAGTGVAITNAMPLARPPQPVPSIGAPRSTNRPFVAASFVHQIPSSIDDTGATDVTAAINAWIAGLPDGAVAAFGTNKTYRVLTTLVVNAKANLTFLGGGSTFNQNTAPAVDNQAMWELDDCPGVTTLSNMRLVGAFATPGTYNASFEHNHGVALFGSTATIDNVTITNVGGDLVYYGQGFTGAKNPSGGGWQNSTASGGCGRNAISYVSAQTVRDQDLTFTSNIGLFGIDAEPNTGVSFYVDDVVATRIAFNCNVHSATLQVTEGNPVSNVTYSYISTTDVNGLRVALGQILGQVPIYRPSNITLDHLSCPTQYTNSGAWYAEHIDGLTVTNNAIPMWVVSTPGYLMTATDCTSVTDSANDRSVDAGPNFPAAGTVNVVPATSGTASIALVASGAGGAAASGTAALAVVATGAGSARASGTAALSLVATGTASLPASGTASLTLTATGSAAAPVAGTASLTLSASGGASAAIAGTAALSLVATGAAQAPVVGTAALTLTATGTARASVAGTAALALTATGAAAASVAGSGAITLTASGSASGAASGTAALTLTATGTAASLGVNTGTAALSLVATGVAAAPTSGTAALTLAATGSSAAPTSGTASVTLTATGTARAPVAGTATLTLLAAGTARATASGTALLSLVLTGTATVPSPIAYGRATGASTPVPTARTTSLTRAGAGAGAALGARALTATPTRATAGSPGTTGPRATGG